MTIFMSLADDIRQKTAEILAETIAFRHECHRHPELTWQEEKTSQRVADQLRRIPDIEVSEGIAKYGVVGLIEGEEDGPTVALRADMDALPIVEASELSYASKHHGVMHACGHDGHMANLLGAAKVIASLRPRLRGRVKLIFQPAEEGGAGALKLCEAGVLENPQVDVIFGMHGWPEAACGEVLLKSGTLLASNTEIHVTVKGKGCHAAMPHLGTDQVLIAARMIDQLQALASRMIAPTDAIALSITQIQAGSATNIIPAEVSFAGTLRTINQKTRERCLVQIERLLQGIAAAHGVHVDVRLNGVYPETVNHEEATDWLEEIARLSLPADKVRRIAEPSMGAEDFSYYLQRVPGSFFFLGTDDGRAGGYPPLHHPEYDFNDLALATGIQLFANLGLAYGYRA
ncbi:MAG: M20 metallopeptidase family protein [Oligoflexus sp.]